MNLDSYQSPYQSPPDAARRGRREAGAATAGGGAREALPAAIDFGNGGIRVLVAEALEDGALRVLGAGEAAGDGLEEGRIVDLAAATAALERAVREAELQSEREIGAALAAVSGRHIKSYAREGHTVLGAMAAATDDPYVVAGGVATAADMARVRRMGAAAVARDDEVILDIVDKQYRLDRGEAIRDPRGMSGRLLSGAMRIIAANKRHLDNMEKCVQAAGLTLAGRAAYSGLAAAAAALSEEEKQLGVCLLDIGAQTTEMMICVNGGVYETEVWLEAGDLVHRDVSAVHHATLASAERCKKLMGVLSPARDDDMLELVSTSGAIMRVPQTLALRTIRSRVEELVAATGAALRRFEETERRKLTAGVVLTGGGAQLPGLAALFTQCLHVPARLGLPAYDGELRERVKDPRFAVCLGLLRMARDLSSPQRPVTWWQRLCRRATDLFFPSPHSPDKDLL